MKPLYYEVKLNQTNEAWFSVVALVKELSRSEVLYSGFPNLFNPLKDCIKLFIK